MYILPVSYLFISSLSQVTNPEARLKQASLLQMDSKDKVWNTGCIEAIKSFINLNLYIVAGSALGVALMQVVIIYFSPSLTKVVPT